MARRWIEKMTRRSVVVHLRDGASIRGVLVEAHGDCLVLTAAEVLATGPGEGPVPADGRAVLPREGVSWIQDLTPGEGGPRL